MGKNDVVIDWSLSDNPSPITYNQGFSLIDFSDSHDMVFSDLCPYRSSSWKVAGMLKYTNSGDCSSVA